MKTTINNGNQSLNHDAGGKFSKGNKASPGQLGGRIAGQRLPRRPWGQYQYHRLA